MADDLAGIVERWMTIPGEQFRGNYEASDQGRIRSLPRPRARGGIMSQHERYGYLSVPLSTGGPTRLWLVHRLVLKAFIGPCPEGHEAAHANGDRKDNRLVNLRWATKRENNVDREAHGKFRRTMLARRVLNPDDVRFIRQNRKVITQPALAEMFGVHRATIQRVQSGERYADVAN